MSGCRSGHDLGTSQNIALAGRIRDAGFVYPLVVATADANIPLSKAPATTAVRCFIFPTIMKSKCAPVRLLPIFLFAELSASRFYAIP